MVSLAKLSLQQPYKDSAFPLTKKHIRAIIEQVFRATSLQEPYSVNIRIVDEEESYHLNKTYRHKDKSTNVLSFPSHIFDLPSEVQAEMKAPLLGDLIICLPVVITEAKAQNKPIMDHLTHMIIHGTLHLRGYDHEIEHEAQHMEDIERGILSCLNISDPYQGDDV